MSFGNHLWSMEQNLQICLQVSRQVQQLSGFKYIVLEKTKPFVYFWSQLLSRSISFLFRLVPWLQLQLISDSYGVKPKLSFTITQPLNPRPHPPTHTIQQYITSLLLNEPLIIKYFTRCFLSHICFPICLVIFPIYQCDYKNMKQSRDN